MVTCRPQTVSHSLHAPPKCLRLFQDNPRNLTASQINSDGPRRIFYEHSINELSTSPLRLPHSIRAGVAQISKEDGTCINQFANIAVAEKLATIPAETFFANSLARRRECLRHVDAAPTRRACGESEGLPVLRKVSALQRK